MKRNQSLSPEGDIKKNDLRLIKKLSHKVNDLEERQIHVEKELALIKRKPQKQKGAEEEKKESDQSSN